MSVDEAGVQPVEHYSAESSVDVKERRVGDAAGYCHAEAQLTQSVEKLASHPFF
jgi:hypothetical protein